MPKFDDFDWYKNVKLHNMAEDREIQSFLLVDGSWNIQSEKLVWKCDVTNHGYYRVFYFGSNFESELCPPDTPFYFI